MTRGICVVLSNNLRFTDSSFSRFVTIHSRQATGNRSGIYMRMGTIPRTLVVIAMPLDCRVARPRITTTLRERPADPGLHKQNNERSWRETVRIGRGPTAIALRKQSCARVYIHVGSGQLLRLLLLPICKHQCCLGCSRLGATGTFPRTVIALLEQCSRDGLPKCIPETLREQQKQCGAGWPTLTVLRKEYRHCTAAAAAAASM